MRMMKQSTVVTLVALVAIACAAPTGDGTSGDGDGDGDGVGDGDAVPTTGGTASTGDGDGDGDGDGLPATGGTAQTGTGGTTTVGTGGTTGGGTCTPIMTGLNDVAEQWWAGSSNGSGTPGADNKSISGPAIAGFDMWDGPTGWANVSYAFGAAGACVNGTSATSISVSVTANVAGNYRIGIVTEASETSSNHYQSTQTFTQGETKTVSLNLDASNLTSSWDPPDGPFDRAHMLQVVVLPLTTDESGLAAYDFSMDNVTVN